MVVKVCIGSAQEVKWIESDYTVSVPHLEHKTVIFYKKCLFGALTLSIGDYILVSNADSPEPDTIAGCDIAKILHLYELREMSNKYPYRAVVQWYSRPENIPHKEFDSDEICIDFSIEVIEDHRSYDSDISLETILQKCTVITGNSADSASGLIQHIDLKRKVCPLFVCRYKFFKEKQSYRLIPLQCPNDSTEEKIIQTKSTPSRKSTNIISMPMVPMRSLPENQESNIRTRRQSCTMKPTAMEFVDINDISNENKVSPIKIIGGKSVVKLSSISSSKRDISDKYVRTSPLGEKTNEFSPKLRSTARRNLNLSIDNELNVSDSNYLNYSIIKKTPDHINPINDIKIKLRVSERQRSTRINSNDDPLSINPKSEDLISQHQRKGNELVESYVLSFSDVYNTPSKKLKNDNQELKESRRKSILKSTVCKDDGTPKRKIHLSNIVEQRIYESDEIISTPKRGWSKKNAVTEKLNYEIEKNLIIPTDSVQYLNLPNEHSKTTYKKKPRPRDMIPTITVRKTPSKNSIRSNLQIVRESLHVSVVPTSLPCREIEFNNIYNFLQGKIQDQCGGCMYVSGVPGTGKTATVTAVIRMLQREMEESRLAIFEFIEINGMRLTEPRQAYVQIYKQLTGKLLSWEQAHSLLEKRFTTFAPRRVTTVLLVDELDILCNRRQDVVYNLLDWPSKSSAQLVVVTIANTMDLPERLLMGKVTSRLGLTRLTFQPYTHKQLQEIVTARLSGSEAFKSDAVQLVARKVAAVSGDARRALDICRRATEIAEEAYNARTTCVNMMHVQQALNEMIASAKVQAIKNCSRLEQIFLQAVIAEVARTGVEETSFIGIYTQMETIAAFLGVIVPSTGRALRICSKLGSERLIICEHSRNDIFQKILLNVSMDDIHYALKVNSS